MKSIVYAILLLALALADKHALILATADGWSNYSITSNPCRAYDDFVKMGVPPENIIFMTFHKNLLRQRNPYPGMIFTDPAENTDGDWAQYGCFDHIDYTDENITVNTFNDILSGKIEKVAAATGKKNPKVLTSGPEDNLFMYIMDHGDYGVFYVDGHEIDRWSWKQSLTHLWENKKYKYCAVFMEACYGGSMWASYPDDRNIIAITSADDAHSAAMSNCPPSDKIGDRHLDTCISGLFDNSYLAYIEEHPDATIDEVYTAVYKECAQTSHQTVSMWGDFDLADMKISDFLGPNKVAKTSRTVKRAESVVPVPEVPLHLAKWAAIRADKENSEEAMKEYQELVYARAKEEVELMRLGALMKNEKEADRLMNTKNTVFNAGCLETMVYQLIHECNHTPTFTDEAVNMLRGLCEGRNIPNIDWKQVCM